MTATDWIVVVGGIAAIVWVNWYFFLAERSAAVAMPGAKGPSGSSAVPEVKVTVHGGYDPATIRVAAGRPVRLVFDRRESSSCSEELVFPAFNLRRFLPENQRTTIDIIPPAPGSYEFTCGMGMLHGRVIAE